MEEESFEVCEWCEVIFPEGMALITEHNPYEGSGVLLCPDCYDIWEWELEA